MLRLVVTGATPFLQGNWIFGDPASTYDNESPAPGIPERMLGPVLAKRCGMTFALV